MGKGGWAFIVNEAHGLRRDVMKRFLCQLEGGDRGIPPHVVYIFTTTSDGQATFLDEKEDAGPFTSRCLGIALARRDLAESFAARVREIATAENLNGQPIAAYVRLAQTCRNNFRAMLGMVEMGKMKV